jgi:hypothetical protein
VGGDVGAAQQRGEDRGFVWVELPQRVDRVGVNARARPRV